MPRVEDAFEALRGSRVYGKIDLKSGFHQIAMAEESQEYTAFSTPFGLYQWKSMPFGLSNAPASFMALMYEIFRPIIGKFVFVYFDDILIYSRTETKHANHVEKVLSILRANKLVAHRRKSEFYLKKIEYVGHLIDGNQIKPLPDEVDILRALPPPRTTKELQRGLGMMNYYRRFISNFSKKTKPLFDCLKIAKNEGTTQWYPSLTETWEQLCQEFHSELALGVINHEKPFIITTPTANTP